MHRTRNIIIIVGVVLVVLAITSATIHDGVFESIVTMIIAITGAIAIWYQLKKEKDIDEASFIVNLNNSFVENDGIKKIYSELRGNMNTLDVNPFDAQAERRYIVDYLTYFETIYILYKKDVFSIAELDEMFAFRFFIAINDPYIQQIELKPNGPFYEDLYILYKPWKEYRLKKGKSIVKAEHDFQAFYEANVIAK